MNPLAMAIAGNRAQSGGTANPLFDTGDGDTVPGAIDIGPVGSGLLSASTMAPGWVGLGLGALQGAGRLYNAAGPVNDVRANQGLPSLDAGQLAGAAFGLNQYGNLGGGNTVANPEQLGDRLNHVPAYALANQAFGQFGTPAETSGGSSYQEGPGGLLGWAGRQLGILDPETHRSFDVGAVNRLTQPDYSDATGWASDPGGEPLNPTLAAAMRKPFSASDQAYMAAHPGNAGGAGVPQAHQVYSAPIGPTIGGAPMPSNVLSAKDQAALALFNAKNGYDASGKAYGNSGMAGGNFQGGQGQAGTVAGGQFGNQQTGGMAGPVNRNDQTGMLSRI